MHGGGQERSAQHEHRGSWHRSLSRGPQGFFLAVLGVPLILAFALPEALLGLVTYLFAIPLTQLVPLCMPLIVRHLYMTCFGRLHIVLLKMFQGTQRHSRLIRVNFSDCGGAAEVAVFPLPCLADNYAYLVVNSSSEEVLRGAEARARTEAHDREIAAALPRGAGGQKAAAGASAAAGGEAEGGDSDGDALVRVYRAVLVDPCDPVAVVQGIRDVEQQHMGDAAGRAIVEVEAILTTHKHWDHAGGNTTLMRQLSSIRTCVGGEEDNVFGCNLVARDGDTVDVGGLEVEAIASGYHTEGSLSFLLRGAGAACFTGDALFVGGCGAPFEGSHDELLSTFWRLQRRMPPGALLFPGHEYTAVLLQQRLASPAASKMPLQNFQLLAAQHYRAQHCRRLRDPMPTVPVRLNEEACTNQHFIEVAQLATALQRAWRMRVRMGLGGVGDAAPPPRRRPAPGGLPSATPAAADAKLRRGSPPAAPSAAGGEVKMPAPPAPGPEAHPGSPQSARAAQRPAAKRPGARGANGSQAGAKGGVAKGKAKAAKPTVLQASQIGAQVVVGFRSDVETLVKSRRRGNRDARRADGVLAELLAGGMNVTYSGRPARPLGDLSPASAPGRLAPAPVSEEEELLVNLGAGRQMDGRGRTAPSLPPGVALHEPEAILALAFRVLGDERPRGARRGARKARAASGHEAVPQADGGLQVDALELALRSLGDAPLSEGEFEALWAFVTASAQALGLRDGGDAEAPREIDGRSAARALSLMAPPEKLSAAGWLADRATCGWWGRRKLREREAREALAAGEEREKTEEELVEEEREQLAVAARTARAISSVGKDHLHLLPFAHHANTCHLCVAYAPQTA